MRRGQTGFESALIMATALTIILLGLAFCKTVQPQTWNETVIAYSDVTRDLAWQADAYVAEWRSGNALKVDANYADYTPHAPGGPSRLRPAADPMKDFRALGH